jgi:hypothetical protein
MITEIKPTSPTILSLLKTIENKDFVNGEHSFAKNYDGLSYYDALMAAISDDTLFNHLDYDIPILKYKHNKILGDTEGGKFFLESFQQLVEFDGFYTSGYIPKGFDRWHSDSDVTGYAILFSYSKDGNGYFKYKIPGSREIVTLVDEPGWMIRGMYYGNVEDSKLWHCVASEGFRVTFILTFAAEDKYNTAVEILTRA